MIYRNSIIGNPLHRAIFFLFLIFLSITEAQESEPITARLTIYQNIWEVIYSYYQEPIERCFIITWWGDMFSYTTGEEKRISNIPVMVESLKKIGIEVSDIALIAHNHWGFARPSQDNMETYKYLKNLGFKGAFTIFSISAKIIYVEKGNMKRYLTLPRFKKEGEKK